MNNKQGNKKLVIMALFGLISFVSSNQRPAKNQDNDLFLLDEDQFVITTP